jgi:hypothetical protein
MIGPMQPGIYGLVGEERRVTMAVEVMKGE